ncbi:hypothetical protein [Streptomyces hilarionis]|uniref:hypothetical protein n=1 Tax=Streptomyces hilarionis TaxID=2839954 RepID=UPI002119FC17|nr:hypothetical protein [Streptomyces hilarionis]
MIHAYVLDSAAFGALRPAASFRPRAGDDVVESVVRPDLKRVVYTTLNTVVSLTRGGEPVWTAAFEPRSGERHGHRPGCALSLDGRTVWVYRPDAMAGRAEADQRVGHDADDGTVLARRPLETVGHAAGRYVHPLDGTVYLDIGEGQDGSVVVRSTAGAGGAPEFDSFPWSDRCLIGLSPDGRQFMTVDHDQADVAFHRHPDGEVLLTLSVDAFGHDPQDTFVEWSGGCLTPDTAVVTLGGEREDEEEWCGHHLVDVRTGAVRGEWIVEVNDPYGLVSLGDGSWLTAGRDGTSVHRMRAPLPASARPAGT